MNHAAVPSRCAHALIYQKNNNTGTKNDKETNVKKTRTRIKTHRKGREFGLVGGGAVLLHKAAGRQL